MSLTQRSARIAAYVACAWSVCLVIGAGAAHGQSTAPPPVVYELMKESSYVSGCFPPCACPITAEQPIRGTFTLARAGSDPLFTTYAVSDIRWMVMQGDVLLPIAGSGTYRVGGEVAITHQLTLDLRIGDKPPQRFDSGLVPGGGEFPEIHIVISIHGMYCDDVVIRVHARPQPPPPPPPPLPRHASFVVDPQQSNVELSLFAGGGRSPLTGAIRLFLGDPNVPVIAVAGMVGISVDGADLIAPDFTPDVPGVREPLHMIQDPRVRSIGSWNTLTGQIAFELQLIAPEGNLPVPMPLRVSGTLVGPVLNVSGNNGNVADARMTVKIVAREVVLPPPDIDIWFSTEVGFGAVALQPTSAAIVRVSDGDLLSRRGYIVRSNRQLTARLGIMPVVPDLGLDAAVLGPGGSIWFSFEERNGPVWSETLGVWLRHGDLLSDAGRVVRTNEQLLARFVRMAPVDDAGLDAVALAPNAEILFSTERDFYSQALGRRVGHGDLLSDRGRIVRTNAELLANFRPMANDAGAALPDYGLDAVVLRPDREIWFSTEVGFTDARLGPISDGDLLSTRGYVVLRNLELVKAFGPVEDVGNFGLDAVTVVTRQSPCDFDFDGDVDLADFLVFQSAFNGANKTARAAVQAVSDFDADLDNDFDVDAADFLLFQACFNGANRPAACR